MANTAAPRSARYSGLFKNDVNDRLDLYDDGVKVASYEAVGSSPRFPTEFATRVDIDAQSGTISAANMKSGLIVHTSVTGAGTITTDTGANIDAAFPGLAVGDVIKVVYLNDGTQTVTLTGATGATVLAARAYATLTGGMILFIKTGVATYSVVGV